MGFIEVLVGISDFFVGDVFVYEIVLVVNCVGKILILCGFYLYVD